MPDFIVQPNPHIHLTDADPYTLPLNCFHILAMVEPDPESWMNTPGDHEKFHILLQTQYDLISEELYPESDMFTEKFLSEDVRAMIVPETEVLWVGGFVEEDMPTYYKGLAEFLATATFSHDYEEYQALRYYIRGVALDHPDWRVAVIGAMYEDDVMRVANAIQESGLEVTVLTRYCISSTEFVNLDELMALRSELRRRGILENELDDLDLTF